MKSSLIQGIERFRASVYAPNKELYEKLAEGQSPHTLFLTCSDSRIQPDVLTGVKPGELFISRNIGNVIPPPGSGQCDVEAVIEFAVVALGVRDIIVCGHTQCGAMKGLLAPEQLEGLPVVASWLTHARETRERVARKYGHLQGAELLDATIRENVLVQTERVKALPYVAPRVADGSLEVHSWVYSIEDGQILHSCKDHPDFVPLTAEAATRELAN